MEIVIGVDREGLSCQRVRRGQIVWRVMQQRVQTSTVDEQVSALLMEVRGKWRRWRSRVDVTLGGAYAQVRCLEGLPELARVRDLTSIVHENPFAFFLRTAPTLLISDVYRGADGRLWAAAFDPVVIDSIARGVVLAGFRVGRVSASFAPPTAPCELAGVLAVSRLRSSIAGRRFRVVLAPIAVIVVSSFAYVAPGVHASLLIRHARTAESARGARNDIEPSDSEIRRSSARLQALERLDARRGNMTRVLAALSRTLPLTASVRSIRIDSVDATITIIAPRIGETLDSLEANKLLTGARLVGGLSRAGAVDSGSVRATIRGRLIWPRE